MGDIRVFLALDLPPELRAQLSRLQQELRPSLPGIHWVRPELMHLTLKFFGNVERSEVDRLFQTLQEIGPLQRELNLAVEGLGVFPHLRNPRVLWVGISDPVKALNDLHGYIQALVESLGFAPEEKPYHPHLTLARIKSDGGRVGRLLSQQGLLDSSRRIGSLMVDRMILFQSTLSPAGPEYHPLWEIPFGNTDPISLEKGKSLRSHPQQGGSSEESRH